MDRDLAEGNGVRRMRLFSSRLSVQADTWKLPIRYSWTKISGPGPVVFQTSTARETNVTFSVVGNYIIRISATDGVFETHDDASILVVPAVTPLVNAGPNLVITQPANFVVVASSSASDPEGAPLTYAWTQVSGPVGPTFSNATVLHPTISFGVLTGTFVFRLTVSNGLRTAFDDMQVTVSPSVVAPNPGIFYDSGSGDVYDIGFSAVIPVSLASDPVGLGTVTATLTIPGALGVYSNNPFIRTSIDWYVDGNLETLNVVGPVGIYTVNWSVVSTGNPTPTTGFFQLEITGL